MTFKRINLFTCILFCTINTFAQSNGTVLFGSVKDRLSNQTIEFANLQLLNSIDSSIVNATATDKRGRFSFKHTVKGNYILLCTFISYEKVYVQVTIADQQRINLGVIEISSLSKNMDEVVVNSRPSTLNTSIDRKIYNVSQDIMAQSGSASEILKNIPSVEVDIEGNVSLRGSEGVLILINGKPSPLMGKSRAEVLQQLPANSIERIEVITNPSARFKPDGTSGIINIVMKKNIKSGWNGTFIGNLGNKKRYGVNGNLSYKKDNLTAFGSYGIRKDYLIRTNEILREVLDNNSNITGYYNEFSQAPRFPFSKLATLGFEYELNDQNSIGISGNYVNRELLKDEIARKFFYNSNRNLISQYDRLRYDPETEKEVDGTIFWQHNFPKENHELRFEFNISSDKEVEDNRFTNAYYFPTNAFFYDNTFISKTDNQKQITIDYSNPLSEDSKIEAGYDGSFAKLDPTFLAENYDTTQKRFIRDVSKSNKFIYNEAIHAFYTTYQRSYGAFGYSAGLRAEQSFIDGNLVTRDSLINNQYFNIYPTLHLGYKFKESEVQLNYSKRVNRPDEDDLNPFPEYRDPRNLQAGNPKLLPEITHSFEFGYKWQNSIFSFVPSLYYRYKKYGFTSIVIPLNDSTLLTTLQNLSNDQSAGLELILSAKDGKFFTSNLSANFFYNTINGDDIGFAVKRSIYSMSANFNSTFVISKSTMFQISSNYRSARLTPQGKTYGTVVFNAGLRKDFFNRKVSVTFTGSDIFKTLRQKTELNTPFLKQVSIGYRDPRIIYLGIAYRFGKTSVKNDEKLQFDNNL